MEVLSKSVEDVYQELRSLQQGMVKVQDSLTVIRGEPGGDKRRRPRRLQFYDSDSEDSSVYFSASEEAGKNRQKAILRRHLTGATNGHAYAEKTPFGQKDFEEGVHLNGFGGGLENGFVPFPGAQPSPHSPLVRTPSDDESDIYEDAGEEFDETLFSGLTFEKEYER